MRPRAEVVRAAVLLATACTGPTVNDAPEGDGGSDVGSDVLDAGGSEPEVLASGRDCPTDLRLFAGAIVWSDQGSLQNNAQDGVIATMPAAGCADAGACIVALATNQPSPSAVEVDQLTGTVYWATVSSGSIWRLPPQATAPESIAGAQDYPRWLGIDDVSLYWINAGGYGAQNGEVRRSYLEDGTPGGLAIVSSLESPVAIEVHPTGIYWTNDGFGESAGLVMSAEPTGMVQKTVATAQSHPRGLAVSPSYVYWANTGDGTLMRARHDGTERTRLIDNRPTPSDIALDSERMYWVEAGTPVNYTDGAVMSATLDGTDIRPIATGQLDPRRIELDVDHVYWINRGTQGVTKCAQHDGAVLRAPKH